MIHLGYIATPVITHFKVFIQELCEGMTDWDQPITGDTLQRWQCLVDELQEGRVIMVPRYLCSHNDVREVNYELRGFCDASLTAYAAEVYLVIKTS